MFGNVLIGVDGRAGGRDAIALAKVLAAPGASFTLAHVDAAGPASWWDHQAREERMFDRSASMLATERECAAIRAAIVCVASTSPASGLHDLAEQRACDVIVVGSSRHPSLGRVLLRDDARSSLDGAPCAVAIAPSGFAVSAAPLDEIGVGYDGSPASELALAAGREFASRAGATIHALRVVAPQHTREEEPSSADWRVVALGLVRDRSARPASADGIIGEVVCGSARRELAYFSHHLDLLIVGARAHGPPDRTGHASISRYLAGHAACPLLVVPVDVATGSVVRAA